jgi:hypothetical protein
METRKIMVVAHDCQIGWATSLPQIVSPLYSNIQVSIYRNCPQNIFGVAKHYIFVTIHSRIQQENDIHLKFGEDKYLESTFGYGRYRENMLSPNTSRSVTSGVGFSNCCRSVFLCFTTVYMPNPGSPNRTVLVPLEKKTKGCLNSRT